ncbi:MAG: hypothetical protein HY683_06830 [Chloroflexi bacterium]|nr:hypothetical protein [Chloroflexota bacterium]
MGTTLKRTTIFLTEEQHERLRRLAFERRTSMAKLLRDAAVEILEDEEDIREGLKALEGEQRYPGVGDLQEGASWPLG